MDISESIIRINEHIACWQQRFDNSEKIVQEWKDEHVRRQAAIEEECKNAVAKFSELKKKVMIYCHIAEDNSYRKFDSKNAMPLEPDIVQLSRMASEINDANRDDPMAGQMIELAGRYIAYLDLNISQIEQEKENKRKTLLHQDENFLQVAVDAKREIMREATEYLSSEEIQGLFFALQEWEEQYEISWESLSRKEFSQVQGDNLPIGWQEYPFQSTPWFKELLGRFLGKYYNSVQNSFRCPKETRIHTARIVQIEYMEKNKERLKNGIQALLLNALQTIRAEHLRVTILDEIYYSRELLGPLCVLASETNSVFDPIPSNESEIKSLLSDLNSYYKKQELKLGMRQLYQYNAGRNEEDQQPYRILILNRPSKQILASNKAELNYLINNAKRLGIFVIFLYQGEADVSNDTMLGLMEKQADESRLYIISDLEGEFFISDRDGRHAFSWLENRLDCIPEEFVQKIYSAVMKEECENRYFNYFSYLTPQKSVSARKPLRIPFAIDQEGQIAESEFEDENFAAYMMGASRSGKSTLLHMMIGHVIMNYHPNEVELWLMDFKLTEFARYAQWDIPHIKYLLAEDSSELAYDILDKLTEEMNRRKREFSRNGWSKQTEVPINVYMPQVFVIIDEFARFSQYIKETKGEGYDKDYTLKLENMLAQGAALGFRFLFSSQTYSDGVPGLTETARKQIQTRFALKNTYQEIKDTLNLSSMLITTEVERWMNTLPVHESLYKWRDATGEVRIERLNNMYMERAEMERIIQMLHETLRGNYVDKKPILISGNAPRSFREMLLAYREYEAQMEDADMEEDIYIYAGVPRSFYLAKPFGLNEGVAENILLVGGSRESRTNVILSIIDSYLRKSKYVEIWADSRNRTLKRYRDTLFQEYEHISDIEDILLKTREIRMQTEQRRRMQKLIVLFGYEGIREEWEMYGEDFTAEKAADEVMDMAAMLAAIGDGDDAGRASKKIEEYNQGTVSTKADKGQEAGDLFENMDWILRRASVLGVHFLVCFERPEDFRSSKLDAKFFRHKLAFSMNRTDSQEVIGNGQASRLPEETFIYSDGKKTFTMSPHIHPGIACNGWVMDEVTGAIVLKE